MKKYDIVAKVGTYTQNGETKGRFMNVGVMMEKDGRPYILLNRTFNPAGINNLDGRDTVLLSLYEPKNEANAHSQAKGNGFAPEAVELDDSIPY